MNKRIVGWVLLAIIWAGVGLRWAYPADLHGGYTGFLGLTIRARLLDTDAGWVYTRPMKAFKLLFLSAALGAVFSAVLPQPAVCLMSSRPAAACPMPCCKTPSSHPRCPFVRPAAQKDSIAYSGHVHFDLLKVVSIVALKDFPAPSRQAAAFFRTPELCRSPLQLSPQIGPAPPLLA